jgi:iron complex outermembrane recepter protein
MSILWLVRRFHPRVLAVVLLIAAVTSSAEARQGTTVSGRLVHSVTAAPVENASIVVEGTRLQTKSGPDGTFSLANVPPGAYHLLVTAPGFTPTRRDIEVASTALAIDIRVDPQLHYSEVVSVGPGLRDQFEAYQPTSVLSGQELFKQVESTLGATLSTAPGVAVRSFGPGPSRPVIRGLDGDRVLILEDGQRTGDLSSQSGDHGVNINPAAASRIEVVRGPATLLYGANAIGGLVNVLTNHIPREAVTGASGGLTFDLGSGASEGGAAGDVTAGNGSFAFHAGGGGRRSGDVKTPEGQVDNSQSRGAFANVGAAWTGAKSSIGASYGYDDVKYGIPLVEEGNILLTPRRHSFDVRAEGRNYEGPIESYRASVGVRRYKHDELEGDEVGTQFTNHTAEVELLAGHRAAGRLKGTVGVSALSRSFEAIGEEALAPPVDQRGVAAFLYEELSWRHAVVQFGGRVDHASYEPQGGLLARDFNNFSGSVGLLLRPRDTVTLAFSLARAARHPALEELYFNGAHPGNFAFEVGNDQLGSERALGFDAALRWRHYRGAGEITYFRNRIDDYIFRQPTGEEGDEFPVVNFIAADSLLQGIESHFDVRLSSRLVGEVGVDYVRAELRETGQPLPRIPPLRARFGLRYQANAFQAGGDVVTAAKQDRLFENETETDGYTTLKLFAAYSLQAGQTTHTVTARLDNATNELYQNHLSFIKDFVPEMGRSFKLVYGVRF